MEIVKSKIHISLRNCNAICPLYDPGFSINFFFVKNLKQHGVESKYTWGKHIGASQRKES